MIHEEMAAPEDCVDMTASYTTIVEAADQPSVDSALDLDHLPNPHHEAMATRKQTLLFWEQLKETPLRASMVRWVSWIERRMLVGSLRACSKAARMCVFLAQWRANARHATLQKVGAFHHVHSTCVRQQLLALRRFVAVQQYTMLWRVSAFAHARRSRAGAWRCWKASWCARTLASLEALAGLRECHLENRPFEGCRRCTRVPASAEPKMATLVGLARAARAAAPKRAAHVASSRQVAEERLILHPQTAYVSVPPHMDE